MELSRRHFFRRLWSTGDRTPEERLAVGLTRTGLRRNRGVFWDADHTIRDYIQYEVGFGENFVVECDLPAGQDEAEAALNWEPVGLVGVRLFQIESDDYTQASRLLSVWRCPAR